MIRVAIIGASGYTGGELARLLCNHPEADLTVATSRQYEGIALSEVYPHLRGLTDIVCSNREIDDILDHVDLVFCAVPHKTAMAIVPQCLAGGKMVVDLSADFRLRDVAAYQAWYQEHSSPELLTRAVYGLPELYREQIRAAQLVANPGCYPTSIILGLAPLLRAGLIDPASIIADAKSGTSGAGRGASTATLFCEVTDGFRPYKVGGKHRHIPEIEQELSLLSGSDLKISFTPHLLPVSRGILSTIYANLRESVTEEALSAVYREHYAAEPFIRLLPGEKLPATQYVRGSNYCDIAVTIDHRTNRTVITTAIDNIVKGASGQAVQNMNLMCGIPETSGLEQVPLFP